MSPLDSSENVGEKHIYPLESSAADLITFTKQAVFYYDVFKAAYVGVISRGCGTEVFNRSDVCFCVYVSTAYYCYNYNDILRRNVEILSSTSVLFFSVFHRLNYVVVRPAIIYGIGDRQGLSKRNHGFTVISLVHYNQ